MSIDEAIKMINAKAECINKVCKGIYEECNEELCDNCDLCYAQGNNGEQKELCLFCAEWLEELKELKNGSIPIIHGKAELEEHDKQIRADAINEYNLVVQDELDKVFSGFYGYENANPFFYKKKLYEIWKQLKEQNECH